VQNWQFCKELEYLLEFVLLAERLRLPPLFFFVRVPKSESESLVFGLEDGDGVGVLDWDWTLEMVWIGMLFWVCCCELCPFCARAFRLIFMLSGAFFSGFLLGVSFFFPLVVVVVNCCSFCFFFCCCFFVGVACFLALLFFLLDLFFVAYFSDGSSKRFVLKRGWWEDSRGGFGGFYFVGGLTVIGKR